jgi:SAM-dependent methyltransferase
MAEDASWVDSMPEIYDRCLGPALFAPYAAHLAGVVADLAPGAVLELAAGTGIVTRELVRAVPQARITATDLNAAMVAWAAERITGPDWQVADAQSLTFPDSSFDVVVCQFGVMFFPDKPRAFAEAGRVLRPGGTLLFTAWDTVETSDFPAALVESIAAVMPDDPPDFVVRIPYGYHEPDEIERDVAAGGLRLERIERVVLGANAASARAIAEGFSGGTPLRFALEERGNLSTLTDRLAEEMTARLGSGPIEGSLAAYVVYASAST